MLTILTARYRTLPTSLNGAFLTALADCRAEVIIFDTPPLLGLSDANVLAFKVDDVKAMSQR